jgi:hypothetical protein
MAIRKTDYLSLYRPILRAHIVAQLGWPWAEEHTSLATTARGSQAQSARVDGLRDRAILAASFTLDKATHLKPSHTKICDYLLLLLLFILKLGQRLQRLLGCPRQHQLVPLLLHLPRRNGHVVPAHT